MAVGVDFGLSYKDFTRIAWTFVEAFAAVLLADALGWLQNGGVFDWKAWVIAGLAAGWAAVKNFSLSDASPIK